MLFGNKGPRIHNTSQHRAVRSRISAQGYINTSTFTSNQLINYTSTTIFKMTLEQKISHINKIVKAYRSNKGFLEKNCFRKEKSKV